MKITDKITITNEDNMELMARYPDGYFDLAIEDPPYGSGIMKKNKKQRHGSNDTTYRNEAIPSVDYFNELRRVSKRSIIFGCQYMIEYLNPTGSFIVWDKGADPDLHNMSACDIAWYSERKQIKKHYAHWCGAAKCESEPTIHIHQKPVQIYKFLLNNYANAGDRILDTHSGSASLAVACFDYGFELTACERDPEYYKRSIARLKKHISLNQNLFDPAELIQQTELNFNL